MKKQIFENAMKEVFKKQLKEVKVKKKLEVDPLIGIDEATTIDLDDTTIDIEEAIDITGMGGKDVSLAQSYKKEASCNEMDDEEEVEEALGGDVASRMQNVAGRMSGLSGKKSPFDQQTPQPGETETQFISRMKKVYSDMGKLAAQQKVKLGESETEDAPLSMMKAVKEAAPPSDKAEKFISKNKASFKKRYGTKWKEAIYATANKMFPGGK